MTRQFDLDERINLFKQALGFEEFDEVQLREIASHAVPKTYAKGDVVFYPSAPCRYFHVVGQGLVKVSFCSANGTSITYLLAGKGEPLNLVGPFTGLPRAMSATALEFSTLLLVDRDHFTDFAFQHPSLIMNIIHILGQAIDSANNRIIDMREKKVRERVIKILHVLCKKFGSRLPFTSSEIAELAGTTTETALRCLGQLREKGVIQSGRGEWIVLEPYQLERFQDEAFWL